MGVFEATHQSPIMSCCHHDTCRIAALPMAVLEFDPHMYRDRLKGGPRLREPCLLTPSDREEAGSRKPRAHLLADPCIRVTQSAVGVGLCFTFSKGARTPLPTQFLRFFFAPRASAPPFSRLSRKNRNVRICNDDDLQQMDESAQDNKIDGNIQNSNV